MKTQDESEQEFNSRLSEIDYEKWKLRVERAIEGEGERERIEEEYLIDQAHVLLGHLNKRDDQLSRAMAVLKILSQIPADRGRPDAAAAMLNDLLCGVPWGRK
jgi:hypothetical protein